MISQFSLKKEQTQRKKIKDLAEQSEYIPFFPTDDFSKTDGYFIHLFTDKKYTFESKWYDSIEHPRYSNKFSNYQIDFDKLQSLEQKSIEDNSTPLLICFFTNELVVWNINKCN